MPSLKPTDVVAALIRAENEGDAELADQHLSEAFQGITRSAGVEQTRAEVLKEIANPKDASVLRVLDVEQVWGGPDAGIATVRSVVTTERPQALGVPTGAYRNTHVLVLERAEWKCVHWQATRLIKA